MKIYLSNQSNCISTQEFLLIIQGLNIYFQNLCKDWGFHPINILHSTQPLDKNLPNTIIVFDKIDDDICKDYNFNSDVNSLSRVFAKTILESGGTLLFKDDETMTVAQNISSEILGIISNLNMNKWYMDSNMSLWWGDISSPVRGNIIKINIQNSIIGFSDYVLPSYFGPPSVVRPFNKMNTLTSQFSIDEFGYSIKFENNQFHSVFGSNCPQEVQYQVGVYLEEFKTRFSKP